jgi:hypothetical protein
MITEASTAYCCPNALLSRRVGEQLDKLTAQLHCSSRDEALRKAVCAFGRTYGVLVPPGPLPPAHRLAFAKSPSLFFVRLVVPPIDEMGNWIIRLFKKSGIRSFKDLCETAVLEFKPSKHL